MIIDTILATDMTCHFGLTEELKVLVTNHRGAGAAADGSGNGALNGVASSAAAGAGAGAGAGAAPSPSPTSGGPASPSPSPVGVTGTGVSVDSTLSPEERVTICKTLLHAADISNPAKPWKVSKQWSDRVIQEFFAQGDREKEAGLEVSPNMDRDTTDPARVALNFTDFIVAPMFVALTTLLPLVQPCCDLLSTFSFACLAVPSASFSPCFDTYVGIAVR